MLERLHNRISQLYEVKPCYSLAEFVVSDIHLIKSILGDGFRDAKEQLILTESDGYLNLTLFIDQCVLDTLAQYNPEKYISTNNINEYWLAIEGVSHLIYTLWCAENDRPITQLELEMQAEIDKFIFTSILLQQQTGTSDLLHSWLFEKANLHRGLSVTEIERYQLANRYAAKYCLKMQPLLERGGLNSEIVKGLRRFYRLTQNEKIRYIESIH